MKPGIYLIEVKECEGCRGYGTEVWNDMDVPHKLCNGLGYTETRIDAEEWLLSMTMKHGVEGRPETVE